MLESTWLFLGLAALAVTGLALLTADANRAIVLGAVGVIAWGFVAYGALNVEIVTDSGTVVSQSMPPVAMFAVLCALIPGYVALIGPAEVLNQQLRNPQSDEI